MPSVDTKTRMIMKKEYIKPEMVVEEMLLEGSILAGSDTDVPGVGGDVEPWSNERRPGRGTWGNLWDQGEN